MPTVVGPDGKEIVFPDGMSREEMTAVLDDHYGAGGNGFAESARAFAARRTMPMPERSRPGFDAEMATRSDQYRGHLEPTDSRLIASIQAAPFDAARFANAPVRGLADAAEGIIDMGANFAAEVAERPFETLTYPLTAPYRMGENYLAATDAAGRGEYGVAVDRALDTVTAGAETAALFSPTPKGPTAAATTPRTPMRIAQDAYGPPAAPTRPAPEAALRDFERSGIEPYTAGVYADEAGAAGLSGLATQTTAENIVAGIPVRRAMQQRIEQAEQAVERVAARYGETSSPAETGAAVRTAITDFAENRLPAAADARYQAVWDQLHAGRYSSTAQTRGAMEAILNRFSEPGLKALFKNRTVARILNELQNTRGGNVLSFRDLRELRTEIRRMRQDPGIVRGAKYIRDSDLGRIEAALTEDIHSGVASAVRNLEAAGDPTHPLAIQALRDMRTADRWYRDMMEDVGDLSRRFERGVQHDEAAFRRIVQASSAKGGDLASLRALTRAATPAQMDEIASGVLREMGRKSPGQVTAPGQGGFSVGSWVTSWNAMTPEARSLLFGGRGKGSRLDDLSSLARTLGRMKEIERYANTSRTMVSGQTLLSAGSVGALGWPAALGLHAAWAGGGAALMSPGFTRLLVDLTRRTRESRSFARDYSKFYFAIETLAERDAAHSRELQAVLQQLPPPDNPKAALEQIGQVIGEAAPANR